jgi:peptidoglycan/LPS O-acetylase OafA/YrhL
MGAKLSSIQALRGIAVVLVLFSHVAQMEWRHGWPETFLPQFLAQGTGGVDLFFVISGFVMVLVSSGRFQQTGGFWQFIYRRAIRVYPIYWVFSAVVLGVYFLRPGWVNSSQGGAVDFFASFLLLPQEIHPLLGQGWTLEHEVYFYLVFAFALLLPERWLPRFLLGWAFVVALGWNLLGLGWHALDNNWVRHIANPLTMEFILGALAARYPLRLGRQGGMYCVLAGLLLLAAGVATINYMHEPGLRLITRGVPVALIVWGAVAWERSGGLRAPRWLLAVGDASYSIYLSHMLVLSGVARLWAPLRQSGAWDNALVVFLMAVGSVALGFASYRWVEAPLLRWCQTRPSIPLRTRLAPLLQRLRPKESFHL